MSASSWLRAAALIAAVVLLALSLLSIRQARLQAAHELTRARLRVADLDRRMLDVRGEIAHSLTPESLRARIDPLVSPGASAESEAGEPE